MFYTLFPHSDSFTCNVQGCFRTALYDVVVFGAVQLFCWCLLEAWDVCEDLGTQSANSVNWGAQKEAQLMALNNFVFCVLSFKTLDQYFVL